MSLRKQVRTNLVALLSTIPNVTVYGSRVYPITSLPCISVYTTEENADAELSTMGGSDYRAISITVEITDKESSGLDDSLDDLQDLVEAKINSDNTLSGVISCINYESTTIEFSSESEKPVGRASLTFTALT